MTWEQLVEKVIETLKVTDVEECPYSIRLDSNLYFTSNGRIRLSIDGVLYPISENRTPAQMYKIILALTEDEK